MCRGGAGPHVGAGACKGDWPCEGGRRERGEERGIGARDGAWRRGVAEMSDRAREVSRGGDRTAEQGQDGGAGGRTAEQGVGRRSRGRAAEREKTGGKKKSGTHRAFRICVFFGGGRCG